MADTKDQVQVIRVPRRIVESGHLPWKLRLKAWWDGYEIRLPSLRKDGGQKRGHDVRAPESQKPWNDARIGLVQEVWGDGFDRPGGPDLSVELVKPLGLDSSMTVLDIGAGLGGGTRAICKAFDVWITGVERDETLAQVGHELSNIAGMGRKAPIYHDDLDRIELKDRGYDCIFSRETFYQVVDKGSFLQELERGLKPGGHLVFTDYVITDVRKDSEGFKDWQEKEEVTPHVWNLTDYREALKDLKLDIRISENITPRLVTAIKKGWATYMEAAKNSGKLSEQGELIMREAELWMRRLKVLETGEVRIYRFHALKKTEGRLLADW